ncbi:MAG: 2-iminoacetate synthase ThiH [Candidatus Hydrogenedentes bacterium]|nr:2-iminoacetate synthase ThiH [Candidatus Hydrogenedentota bacterium]
MNDTTFQTDLAAWPRARVESLIEQATPADVDRALAREDRSLEDLAALLSPHAQPRLEALAQEAHRLTRWHFGRTIGLYTPIYLSNVCGADCVYCGYAVRSGNREKRVTLNESQIRSECETLARRGFQNILLLTGEAPRVVPVQYIADAVAIAREYFASVSVEVYSMQREEYARLVERGLEGVTIYMETYDPETYARMHLIGAKKNYDFRLDAVERAGLAGARKLGIGVLLGLFRWRVDAFWLAMHARRLQKTCWQSALSISFPRLRHTPRRFTAPAMASDRELVQLMLALRLFLPEVGFNLSTRETPEFRDRLIPLGVTMMSAGSSTRPGGYSTYGEETLEQFEIEDSRTPEEVLEVIRRAGYDPVWKDFDRAFHATAGV